MDFGPGGDKEDTSKTGMRPEISTFYIPMPGNKFGELGVAKFVSIPGCGDAAAILVGEKCCHGWGSGRCDCG